jgi:hypothetical protein
MSPSGECLIAPANVKAPKTEKSKPKVALRFLLAENATHEKQRNSTSTVTGSGGTLFFAEDSRGDHQQHVGH